VLSDEAAPVQRPAVYRQSQRNTPRNGAAGAVSPLAAAFSSMAVARQ